MNKTYKQQIITKASSSQIDDEEPIFYGYIYSDEGDRNHHKERFVDFKNLSQFNERLATLDKVSNDNQHMSIFDTLKRDFPIQKPVVIGRKPTPYPNISKKLKKKNKRSKHKKKTKKSKLQNTSKKHTKKKK